MKKGRYAFKKTIFYGEKGGMLSNKGTINGFEVLDLKYENNVLYYKVDGTLTNTTRMEAEGLTVV